MVWIGLRLNRSRSSSIDGKTVFWGSQNRAKRFTRSNLIHCNQVSEAWASGVVYYLQIIYNIMIIIPWLDFPWIIHNIIFRDYYTLCGEIIVIPVIPWIIHVQLGFRCLGDHQCLSYLWTHNTFKTLISHMPLKGWRKKTPKFRGILEIKFSPPIQICG